MITVLPIALFAGYLSMLLFILNAAQHRWRLGAEMVRKLFHICGGIACLWLPVLFSSVWPVAFLGIGIAVAFVLLRHVPNLRVLSGVQRASIGEICFPFGVVGSFAAASGDRLAYSISVLVLTFADAGAGLVGERLGRIRLVGRKTLEGSSAFFLLAFLVTFLPLTLASRASSVHAIAVAVVLALAITAVEALAPHGLDNLVIPISSLVLLRGLLP